MGVAYNADLHLSDYYGDGAQHWNPSRWAENLDHGKNSGAVVQNNSWGFDDDLNPDVIKNYMDNNNNSHLIIPLLRAYSSRSVCAAYQLVLPRVSYPKLAA